MRRKRFLVALTWLLVFLMAIPPWSFAQQGGEAKKLTQQELDQLVAPIALYPDDLLAQIFMASTYPLEVVMADRWAKQNKDLKGDKLTAALEKQTWDPSVKSLVNFPPVLSMMGEKVEWTEKLGDAFLTSQKDVMGAVQRLRAKAKQAGNLKTTEQQKVVVLQEQQTEVIQIVPVNPQVVYVPTYNPTVVYGVWAYPAYPPYPVYPPGYSPAAAAAVGFGVGLAVGAAWGYAWGNCNWGHGDVNVNVYQNNSINNNINRNNYVNQYNKGQGNWQHDPNHRQGVAYRDQATAQKYNRPGSADQAKARDAYRGRADAARQDMAKGGPGSRGISGSQGQGARLDTGMSRGQGSQQGARGSSMGQQASQRGGGTGGRSDAFSGMGRGQETRDFSNRGQSSRQSMSSGSGSRGSMGGSGSRGSMGGGSGGRSGGGRRR